MGAILGGTVLRGRCPQGGLPFPSTLAPQCGVSAFFLRGQPLVTHCHGDAVAHAHKAVCNRGETWVL